MELSVKSVFKILIGTIVITVCGCCIVELFNVSITSILLRQYSRLSALQACELFTQETWRNGNFDGRDYGASNLETISADDGTVYVYGNFYGHGDPEDIYRDIYSASEFKSFCDGGRANCRTIDSSGNDIKLSDYYNDLAVMAMTFSYLGDPDGGMDVSQAITYKEEMYTPVNIGIPYMDEDITNKMFKWNLTRLLTTGLSGSIQHDTSGYFINFKGFKVFADQAKLSNYEYVVLNTETDSTKLKQLTGMQASQLGKVSEDSITHAGVDNNNQITIVGINYEIPITYIGITPLAKIYDWVNSSSTRVNGLNGAPPAGHPTTMNGTGTTLESGGLSGTFGDAWVTTGVTNSDIPGSGRITYVLTR